MKSSGFKWFQFIQKLRETMSSRHRTAVSDSSNPSEIENGDNNNQTENITEAFRGEASVESNTNRPENTQRNPMQFPNSSFSEIFSG